MLHKNTPYYVYSTIKILHICQTVNTKISRLFINFSHVKSQKILNSSIICVRLLTKSAKERCLLESRMQINTDISLTIDLLGYLLCDRQWTGSSHFHPFWEMVITTSDFQEFKADIFSPNETHKFENVTETEKHLLYIGFDFKHDTMYTEKQIKDALRSVLNNDSNGYFYAAVFNRIQESQAIPADTNFYMQILLFLVNCLDKYMFRSEETAPNTALVSDVKKYINANLHKKTDIKQLAKALYVTPKYLGQVFKKETGEGILQYTKRKKAEKAMLLIKTKAYNVTQISQMLGFDNIHYFSTVFKEYYGLPPTYFYNRESERACL